MPATDAPTTEKPDDGINRLLGMVVHEVSLVDRAANQRKFLIQKKDAPMRVTKDDTAASPALPGGGSPEPAKLAPMQAQVKDQLLQALTAAAEKLVALAGSVKEAETTDAEQTPSVPETVTGQVGEIASMLAGLQSQFGGKPAAAGEGAAPAKADLAGITENGGADQQGEQKRADEAVAKAVSILEGVTKSAEAGKPLTLKLEDVGEIAKALSVVQKAGKKMAKERFERFKKAIDLLAGILKELQLQKVAKSAGTVVTLSKAAAAKLSADLDELATLTKKQTDRIAALEAENVKLKKSVQAPNSLGPSERPAAAPTQVSWPLDLNDPKTAKGKATDFSSPTTGR